MNLFWRRFLAALTPGARAVLILLVAAWLVAVLGRALQAGDLYLWLPLSGPPFWQGQVWRLVTYALLPAGVLQGVLDCLALVLLGSLLERHWTRREFWLFCLVTVPVPGLVKVALQSSSPLPLTGPEPVIFGLLTAWGVLCGRETITLVAVGETTVWKLVLTAGAVSLIVQYFSAGLVAALVLAAGGLTGFVYVRFKQAWLMRRTGSVVHSERIQRLEL